MIERTNALKLMEMFKDIWEANSFSIEEAVRAIAMQSLIFEKMNPEIWEIALADAKIGIDLALPETKN